MRDAGNILDVSAVQPDFMGFIFYPKSPRYVGDAFSLPSDMPDTIKRVGVFVKEKTDVILKKVSELRLDFVQLHGGEEPDQCRILRSNGVGVMKVFSVDDNFDFSVTREYEDCVDYFLFDTRGKLYGGNAKRFNWKILSAYSQRIPFFLSGGIGPEHVDEVAALEGFHLAAIDINSGVEVSPGVKNIEKVKAIKAALNT